MIHASLFSGIGGFDVAADWMGWENAFHCEWDEFCQRILKYYWPNAISYGNIDDTDFTVWRGKVDVLSGGFPCQPYSIAGKRKGKDDARHKWPQFRRAIQEIKPAWIVGENVLGIVNWNGGLVFQEVQDDLEAEGYEIQPFILPVAGVQAPHERQRVWFVAHAIGNGHSNGLIESGCQTQEKQRAEQWQERDGCNSERTGATGITSDSNIKRLTNGNETDGQIPNFKEWFQNNGEVNGLGGVGNVANTNGERLSRKEYGKKKSGWFTETCQINDWQTFPTVSPIRIGDDGLSGRLDGITLSKLRRESIKAGGNAVSPQLVHMIFKAIEKYEKQYV